MNVTELIAQLQKVKDKNKEVKISVNGMVTGNFHLNIDIEEKLYITNKKEKGYKEPELG